MIDFHTHTLFSDGDLLPSELARRAKDIGYVAIAFTDHADFSNMSFILENIKGVIEGLERYFGLYVFYGVELTHIPPELMFDAVNTTRHFGAEIVIVHGETVIEPVKANTNKLAIESRCDILAHPGLISQDDVFLSKRNNVYLEITSRLGHNITNGHVFKISKNAHANCILNTDSHSPEDLISDHFAEVVLKGCGMNDDDVKKTFANSEILLEKLLKRRFDDKKI